MTKGSKRYYRVCWISGAPSISFRYFTGGNYTGSMWAKTKKQAVENALGFQVRVANDYLESLRGTYDFIQQLQLLK